MMRNMRFFTLTILSLLMGIGNCVGQAQPPALASQSPEQGHATVYVYRLDDGLVVSNVFLWFKKTRPVYFSERLGDGVKRKHRKIAALRNKQYFMLRLPAGKYVFDTRMMWGNFELDVVAGGEYYLWVDQGNYCTTEDPMMMMGTTNCETRSASINSVPPERWGKAMSVLEPIRSGDVKDRKLVIIPPGPPSNLGLHPTAK